MENWLNAFARGLLIETDTADGSTTEPATDEQIEVFKEALKADLDSYGKLHYVTDVLTYDYRMGSIRGGSKLMGELKTKSGNGAMHNVLSKLPKLPKGKSYTLPTPTFISFRIRDKRGDETDFAVINVCHWIQQNL